MRPMTWIPVPLNNGDTLAQLVLPTKMTPTEADSVIAAVRSVVPLPMTTPRTQALPEPEPVAAATQAPSELDRESRTVVDTATAAYYLNRRPQTLRTWACHENGPLRPVRIHGRLAWSVADLRRCVNA